MVRKAHDLLVAVVADARLSLAFVGFALEQLVPTLLLGRQLFRGPVLLVRQSLVVTVIAREAAVLAVELHVFQQSLATVVLVGTVALASLADALGVLGFLTSLALRQCVCVVGNRLADTGSVAVL